VGNETGHTMAKLKFSYELNLSGGFHNALLPFIFC
jgi:hypothetical protein